jgi:nicotinamidase-related amidase
VITGVDASSALVAIDLQRGLARRPLVHSFQRVVDRVNQLSLAFRSAGMPVVLVAVNGLPAGRTDVSWPSATRDLSGDFAELVPELLHATGDLRMFKKSPGAFARTELDDFLKAHQVTQVVVVGVTTSGGVESTAKQAWEFGYHVTLPVDAMTDVDSARHEHAVATTLPRIGEVGSVQDVLRFVGARN